MEALEFLQRWAPEGPWCLTSIDPDKKGLQTRTFYPSEVDEAGKWIAGYDGKRNIYFHVNPVMRPVSKKAEREDIAALAWLHVDIDPRVGEDLDEERQRALKLLQEPPEGVPAPSVIIFSGGGYQGFWRLDPPVDISGKLEVAEDLKRYNQQLEVLFGADNCHNIDRIMRLPGTMNMPDARKRKKGRKPVRSSLIEFNDNVYALGEFTPAAAVQVGGELGFGSKGTVRVSGNIERLDSVDDLAEWDVPDRVRVLVVQGRHPDEGPKPGDDSRSSWLFDAVCGLVRAGVPDDVVYSVITDPDFLISESVLDKGSNAEKYAIRQIERAKEEAIDPHLRIMNERHAVIGNFGGRCRVVEELFDASLGRTTLTRQSFEDVRNRYMHVQVQIGTDGNGNPKFKQLGKWWLEHPARCQYERVVFAPNKDVPQAYNLWRGFACEAVPGDCSLFLDHVRENICRGDEVLYEYLLGWMSRAVQHPDSPGQTAVVLRGDRGAGKGFFAKTFGNLFGRHFLQVTDPKHLVGSFNAHLRDCVVLFGDEAFYAGDKKHESVLKALITEETIAIESKGVDVEVAANFTHVLLASNEDWVVPAGQHERRYFVLDVGSGSRQNSEYFQAIQAQLNNGGQEALLHYLMKKDLTEYDVRALPSTSALREQKMFSLSTEEEWWHNKLLEGQLLEDHLTWELEVSKKDLTDDYVEYTRRFNVSRRGNETALGYFLRRMVPHVGSVQRIVNERVEVDHGVTATRKRRRYFWVMPDLDVVREHWDSVYGKQEWPVPVTAEDLDVNQEEAF